MKWYHRPVVVVIAILCAGPFALPLVWFSPAFRGWHKAVISAFITVITVATVKSSIVLYRILLTRLEDLRVIMGW